MPAISPTSPGSFDRALEDFSRRSSDWLSAMLWRYRVELGVVLVMAAVCFVALLAAVAVGSIPLAVAVAVVYGFVWYALRRPMRRVLSRSSVRRRFEMAAEHCGLHHVNVQKVVLSDHGDRLDLRLARGQTFTALERESEALAASMAVREVRVERMLHDASRGSVVVLTAPQVREPEPWPGHAGRITKPFPVGVTEPDGAVVQLDMFHRHVLVGGQTGFGKTNFLDMIIGIGVSDPRCRVLLIDVAKRGAGLGRWERNVEQLAVTRADAIALLNAEKVRVDREWTTLRQQGRFETTRDEPSTLLVIDELAPLLIGKEGKIVTEGLWELLMVGRAAGLNVVAAMQQPHHSVISTSVRNLFSHRVAFRASTPEMGTTVTGFHYDMPPEDYPVGMALMIVDDRPPCRVKTYHSLKDAA